MIYQAELNFFINMLKNFHLPCHYFTYPFDTIPELDLGIRKLLNPHVKFSEYMDFNPTDFNHNTIYYLRDRFNCNYVVMQLPECEIPTFLLIGPYLSAPISSAEIYTSAERLALPANLISQIELYFRNLPILPETDVLLNMLITFGECIWGSTDNFTFKKTEQQFKITTDYSLLVDYYQNEEVPVFSVNLIEERYETESKFIHAVSQGNFLKAEQFIYPLFNNNLEPRAAEPLRDGKNYSIILNTLLRKAAELGTVHPFHIDAISSRFARKIELVSSLKEIALLQREMVHKYCLLVKNHSLKGYSLLVRKVLTQIDTNLTANLTLNNLASDLNVNPSYLSTLFKKETGNTLTEYVNTKRIEHAILLLNTTNLQIQNIAQYCGISDVNYFTKLFKKQIGKTPKEYRETLYPHR